MGTKLVVDTAADIRWQWIFIGTAVVFFFQLLRPLFQKAVKNVSGPEFIMPAIDGSTVKHAEAVPDPSGDCRIWPFMVWHGGYRHLTVIYIVCFQVERGGVPCNNLLGYADMPSAPPTALAGTYSRSRLLDLSPLAGTVSAAAGSACDFQCCVCSDWRL